MSKWERFLLYSMLIVLVPLSYEVYVLRDLISTYEICKTVKNYPTTFIRKCLKNEKEQDYEK